MSVYTKLNLPKSMVHRLGGNLHEVVSPGLIFLVSYNTPVAMHTPNGLFVTEEWYSRTTTKHINSWVKGREYQKVSEHVLKEAYYMAIQNHE